MTETPHPTRRMAHIDYKWIALSNTTLGILMAALNSSIILYRATGDFSRHRHQPTRPR